MPSTRTPPRLSTGEQNSFAAFTVAKRLPAILANLTEHANAATGQALQQLSSEILKSVIQPLPSSIFDELSRFIEPYTGRHWQDTPFLETELYFYARILLAFDYSETNQIDPFKPIKDAANIKAMESLAASTQYCQADFGLAEMLRWSVTGNSTDLSQLTLANIDQISLLVDECREVETLLNAEPHRIDFVLDNAGMDALADLLLIRFLCKRCPRVVAHVRPYPMYVSDVTLADLHHLIETLASHSAPPLRQLGDEITHLLRADHLAIQASPALGLPICFSENHAYTLKTFGDTDLVIFKGDLNYRYFIGDRHWPHTTEKNCFANLFGRPAVTLRTLKSELLVGLTAEASVETKQLEPEWLTNGHYGIIQVFAKI